MTTATPEVGKTYTVRHSRKGTFKAIVRSVDEEWADLEVVAGRADAIMPDNRAEKGESVTVRLSMCSFEPAKGA